MPEIVGEPIFQYFNNPQSVNIANKTFKNVTWCDTRNYMQDDKMHSVSFLTTDKAKYSVYETGGQVSKVFKTYNKPVERKFGDRVFSNIVSSMIDENGVKTYENINRGYTITKISVDKAGKVLNIKKSNKEFDLTTLDGTKSKIEKNDIIICDEKDIFAGTGIVEGVLNDVKIENVSSRDALVDKIENDENLIAGFVVKNATDFEYVVNNS